MLKIFFANFNLIYTSLSLVFVLLAVLFYFRKNEVEMDSQYKKLLIGYFVFELFWVLLKTGLQYWAFNSYELGKLLLQDGTYFIGYVYTRFWLAWLIKMFVGLLFYYLLEWFGRRREGVFYPGETKLGLLTILLAGWPAQIVYLPIMLLATVVISVIRRYVFKIERTAMGWSMLAAALICLFVGMNLVDLLGLDVLILK